ncbi:hypothetical protein [Pseudohalioglobus lutimaris]|uniref:Uncharacterized protein n=1 Tax=Pseudohalioglobus lutimaris TaxID=1737061 RepID=A0A2N5X3A6_9GAMM|nr:hypothetical protein [Pseudohalioglobus lutimaris]PLW68986.1 hypothetical protein C0039_10215 [Pseudohalioglobus lutimaris]
MEALSIVGLILFIVGGLGLLIAAFKTSILWGVGIIVIAPSALIYTVLHWGEAKNPFLLQLLGFVILFASTSGLQTL